MFNFNLSGRVVSLVCDYITTVVQT